MTLKLINSHDLSSFFWSCSQTTPFFQSESTAKSMVATFCCRFFRTTGGGTRESCPSPLYVFAVKLSINFPNLKSDPPPRRLRPNPWSVSGSAPDQKHRLLVSIWLPKQPSCHTKKEKSKELHCFRRVRTSTRTVPTSARFYTYEYFSPSSFDTRAGLAVRRIVTVFNRTSWYSCVESAGKNLKHSAQNVLKTWSNWPSSQSSV